MEEHPDPILWDVVEDHLDESEFLLQQWESALRSPDYDLTELRDTLEERLEAHLDGLSIGGSRVAERLLEPELANDGEPRRAAVAALSLLSSANDEARVLVLDAAETSLGEHRNALARALALAAPTGLDTLVGERFSQAASETDRALWLGVLTAWGVDMGDALPSCLQSGDECLVSMAVQAAERFSRRELAATVDALCGSEDERIRRDALRASLVLGSTSAWSDCLTIVRDADADPESIWPIALLGGPEDQELLIDALSRSKRPDRVAWLLGYCGTVRAGDACVEALRSEDETVCKLAADSLAWIGGFDLEEDRFQATSNESGDDETLPPLEEDDADLDLGLDGVDSLPAPDADAIATLWNDHRDRLARAPRQVFGRPFSPEALVTALAEAPLWRRDLVALELALRTGGEQHCSTDAFSSRQRGQIAGLGGVRFSQWTEG